MSPNKKMKDMGKPMEEVQAIPMNKKVYPSICLTSDQLPEIKDFKLNDKGTMEIKYKVVGLHKGYDNDKELRADIEITGCMVTDGGEEYKEAKMRGLDRKDYEEIQGKKKKFIEKGA